jgi:hypothetical protein
MVQLNILSGKKAGSHVIARRFPFSVGRASNNSLQLEDEGIWDQHLMLEFKRQNGFFLTKENAAFATVNEQAFETIRLHNGDIITVGSAKLQFWLASVRQRGLRLREALVWTIIIAVSAAQLLLIYWLIR